MTYIETVCSTLSAYFYFLKSCLDDVLDSPKLQSPELTHLSRQYLAILKVVSWSCLREKTHGPYINLLCHDLHNGDDSNFTQHARMYTVHVN